MATFDKSKPQGTVELRNSDDMIRDNWAALETAITEGHEFATGGTQTGYHTNPIWKDIGGDPAQPTGTNQIRIANNAETIVGIRQSDGAVLGFGTERGAKALFKQSVAPLGWAFASEDNDRALINTSTEDEGGNTGGSWTVGGLSVDGHTLTVSEMPAHDHVLSMHPETGTARVAGGYTDSNDYTDSGSVHSTGGDGSHGHGVSSDASWRPNYVKVITCSKD